jgi:hypothetical protein
MKIKHIVSSFVLIVVFFITNDVYTFSNGGYPDHVGAPNPNEISRQKTCSTVGCHFGNTVNSAGGTIEISTNIPASGWTPGKTYDITTRIQKAGHNTFGFQTMAWGETDSISTGSLVAGITSRAQIVNALDGSDNTYATHKSSTNSGNESNTWSFQWIAPIDGINDIVVFYNTFVAANSNGEPTGDYVYTKELKVYRDVTINGLFKKSASNNSLSVSPTLVNDVVTISATNTFQAVQGNVSIKVYDFKGVEYYSSNVDGSAFQNEIHLI